MAIVKMKRLHLIALREDRDRLLRQLLHVGCVEVREPDALPEEAEVWGEVSADGESWSRWEDFDLIQEASGAPVAVFTLPDDTQRYFRVVICLGAAGLTALLLHKRKP